jgi:L-fuconolactonase
VNCLVDSQIHVGLDKYRPIEHYLPVMAAHGIEKAVLVQHGGQTDNSYLADCVRRWPDRFVAVALIDHSSPLAVDEVRRIAKSGRFRGIRIPAAHRAAFGEPLAVWRAIDEAGLVATVRGPYADIADPSFAKIVDEFPKTRFHLEHLGCYRFGAGRPFAPFLELAEKPNVFTMWSCFYEHSSLPYPHPDADLFLEQSLRAFGADRITWSGDWNRAHMGKGDTGQDYPRAIDKITSGLSFLTSAQLEHVLWRSATQLYGISPLGN